MRVTDPATGDTFFSKRRRRRIDAEQSPRELTFTCYHRYPFLAKDRTRTWFIEALQEARGRWPVDLWAYGPARVGTPAFSLCCWKWIARCLRCKLDGNSWPCRRVNHALRWGSWRAPDPGGYSSARS